MKSGNRSNALLVELLIVVMFFMLSSTVLLQVFATARTQSDRAALMIQALNKTQNIADRLYAAEDAEAEMAALGFENQDEIWRLSDGEYDISVEVKEECVITNSIAGYEMYIGDSDAHEAASLVSRDDGTETGKMIRFELRAAKGDDVLFTLPVTRYQEVQP